MRLIKKSRILLGVTKVKILFFIHYFMDALGFHYLIELSQCDSNLLGDAKFVEKTLQNSIKICGATKIGEVFHKFSPHGMSGVILISESHFSIHTWPEYRYAALDLFTCDPNLKIQETYDFLVESFKANRANIVEIKRGMNEKI